MLAFFKRHHIKHIPHIVLRSIFTFLRSLVNLYQSIAIKKIIPFGILSVGAIAICTSLTVANKRLTIYDGESVYTRYTPHEELENIFTDLHIQLNADDQYAFSGFDTNKQATLMINRAFSVTVTADGVTKSLMTIPTTVENVLKKLALPYNQDDLMNRSLDETLSSTTDLIIQRVTYKEIVEKQPIDFIVKRPKEKCPSNMREVILQKGVLGERTIKKKIQYIDGVETTTTVIADQQSKKPVEQMVQYVLKDSIGVSTLEHDENDILLDENGIPLNYKYKVTGKATAYSALGKPTKLVPGCVAMDFSKFPKGTKLYIRTPNGSYIYGYSKVADTGSFVHNGSGVLVDLFFNTYAESVKFGLKIVDVYVLD